MGKFNQEETVEKAIQYVKTKTDPEHRPTIDVKEAINWFYYDLLDWCGCGYPHEAAEAVRNYLSLVNYHDEHKTKEHSNYTAEDQKNEMAYCKKMFGCVDIYDNPLLLCLAYTMDSKGLTEHSSSIGVAWLTETGEMLLALLRTKEFEEWTD